MPREFGAWSRSATDALYNPQMPGLATPVNPLLGVGAAGGIGAGTMRASRVVVPKTGTLHDITVGIATTSGNLAVAVYDTGDASAGNRTLLWSSGSVAAGTGSNWQVLGDPALAVIGGQQLDLAVLADNATVTLARYVPLGNAFLALPASFWPAAGGAQPKLSWSFGATFPTFPATVSEANCGANSALTLIMGRVA